ncbi:MAG: hypothetical protein ABIT38_17495, partial [Gemmatimonadaceae bacterium]
MALSTDASGGLQTAALATEETLGSARWTGVVVLSSLACGSSHTSSSRIPMISSRAALWVLLLAAPLEAQSSDRWQPVRDAIEKQLQDVNG